MFRWLRRLWERLMAWTTTTTRATGFLMTAAVWNAEHVANLQHLEEVGYAEITADASITATSEATANQVISLGAISYEAVPHEIVFQCSQARPDTGAAGRTLTFVLEDSTTVVVGIWGRMAAPAAAASNVPVTLSYRFTPTAASHTHNIRAYVSAGTGLITAGSGGAGDDGPACLHIRRVIT